MGMGDLSAWVRVALRSRVATGGPLSIIVAPSHRLYTSAFGETQYRRHYELGTARLTCSELHTKG
jgi:hypothetical protein